MESSFLPGRQSYHLLKSFFFSYYLSMKIKRQHLFANTESIRRQPKKRFWLYPQNLPLIKFGLYNKMYYRHQNTMIL